MQYKLKLKESFSTFDLALAATICLWFPLEIVDKSQDSHKVLFIFRNSKELAELINKYWKKELLVEPRQYFDQIKALKTRIYAKE